MSIGTKITQAFKLESAFRHGLFKPWLQFAIPDYFKRIRVEPLPKPLGRVSQRMGNLKESILETDSGLDSVLGTHPVNCPFDFSAIRGISTA